MYNRIVNMAVFNYARRNRLHITSNHTCILVTCDVGTIHFQILNCYGIDPTKETCCRGIDVNRSIHHLQVLDGMILTIKCASELTLSCSCATYGSPKFILKVDICCQFDGIVEEGCAIGCIYTLCKTTQAFCCCEGNDVIVKCWNEVVCFVDVGFLITRLYICESAVLDGDRGERSESPRVCRIIDSYTRLLTEVGKFTTINFYGVEIAGVAILIGNLKSTIRALNLRILDGYISFVDPCGIFVCCI